MSLKHLSIGSTCPPLQSGKIRIYAMRFCPYVQRVLLVATVKNAPIDVVYINLKEKPEWIFEKNSAGATPTVETEEGLLTESLIVCDYFDESFCSPQLHPKSPFRKAKDRIWVEKFGKIGGVFYQIAYNPNTAAEEIPKLVKEYEDSISKFGIELAQRGTNYFAGNDHPGMLDYMMWPWFERRPIVEKLHPNAIDYEKARETSALDPWIERMKNDSAVKEYLLTTEVHHEYALTVLAGNPHFNLLATDE